MIHIEFKRLPDAAKELVWGEGVNLLPPWTTVCRRKLTPEDTLTEVAMQSDCDECRSKLLISTSRDAGNDRKKFGVKLAPVYTPDEPLRGKNGMIITREKL